MSFVYWVQGLFVLTTIFGVGVTAIELLGILGDSEDADTGGADDFEGDMGRFDGGDVEAISADTIDAEAGFDADSGDLIPTSSGADSQAIAGESTDGDFDADGRGSSPGALYAPLMFIMSNLRRAVYFSLGFGPAGLAALLSGSSPTSSLLWAIPCGLVSMWLARAFFRFQQRDLDSTLKRRDLMFQPAKVLIPIAPGGMGKVRIIVGQSVVDRFARGENESEGFSKGQQVVISRISNECVYVEQPTEFVETST